MQIESLVLIIGQQHEGDVVWFGRGLQMTLQGPK